jgi:hypothetical protein
VTIATAQRRFKNRIKFWALIMAVIFGAASSLSNAHTHAWEYTNDSTPAQQLANNCALYHWITPFSFEHIAPCGESDITSAEHAELVPSALRMGYLYISLSRPPPSIS